MKVLEDDLKVLLAKIELGGGEKARAKVKESPGKLLVRERVRSASESHRDCWRLG